MPNEVRKIKIISNGTPQNTAILLDNGDVLGNVESVSYNIFSDAPARCNITCILSDLEVELLQNNTQILVKKPFSYKLKKVFKEISNLFRK